MKIRVYMKESCTNSLGPNKRFALWVQGCNRKCKNCMSPDSQPINGGTLFQTKQIVGEIRLAIKNDNIEGITISGGEPFMQADAIVEILKEVKKTNDLGVIMYTGMVFDELKNMQEESVQELLEQCDLLVDGEYIDELNDDKSLRGSSNQNVIVLTDRYKNVIDKFYGLDKRQIEIPVNSANRKMIGIPSRAFWSNYKKALGGEE